jgi:hypothetical protein
MGPYLLSFIFHLSSSAPSPNFPGKKNPDLRGPVFPFDVALSGEGRNQLKPNRGESVMTSQKAKWPMILVAVGAIVAYVYARPPIPSKPATMTMSQGTAVEVHLDRAVSSRSSAPGDQFTGRLAEAILVDGQEMVPKDTEFSGKVIQAIPAGRLAGGAKLRIVLTSFELAGTNYAIQTTPIMRVSEGNGKHTAEMAGGGAALGAAMGALAHHHGKGALIGAGVGAGAGVAGSAATSQAHDIVMSSESLLTFKLMQDVEITPAPAAQPQPTAFTAMVRGLFSGH